MYKRYTRDEYNITIVDEHSINFEITPTEKINETKLLHIWPNTVK